MNNQDVIAPDSRAWEMFDRFLTENAKELKLIAHWGDGDLGEMIRLLRERLGFPERQRMQASRKEKLSADLRLAVFDRDGYQCLCCGSRTSLRADHVVPESEGGPSEINNLQTLCQSCNSAKGTKTIDYRKQAAA